MLPYEEIDGVPLPDRLGLCSSAPLGYPWAVTHYIRPMIERIDDGCALAVINPGTCNDADWHPLDGYRYRSGPDAAYCERCWLDLGFLPGDGKNCTHRRWAWPLF